MTDTMATAEASANSLSRRVAVADGAAVSFTEERSGVIRTYDLAALPMPHWHGVLARAFTAVLNLGAIRTLKSADAAFWPIGRFLSHLESLVQSPRDLAELTPENLDGYYRHESLHTTQKAARTQMWQIGRLLRHVEPATMLSIDMRAYLAKARQTPKIPVQAATPGNPLAVQFTDHDGVTFDFDFATLPFPAWQATLADAFTAMLQAAQGSSRRTAQRPFDALRRFLTGLEALPRPPASLGELTVEHLEDFHQQVRAELAPGAPPIHFTSLRRLLMHISPYEQLSTELRHRLEQITYQPEGPAETSRPARPGTGRTSAMPDGPYEAPAPREDAARTLKVHFTGEDGRTFEYDVSKLRHPPFHPYFASAFAHRTGPTGSLRTRASADGDFTAMRQFLGFIAALPNPPKSIGELTPRHLDRFRFEKLRTTTEAGVRTQMVLIHAILRTITPSDVLSEDLREYLGRRNLVSKLKTAPVPGYSDREFKAILTAARSDVVAIRDRIRAGEKLLATYRTAPDSLDADDQVLGMHLDEMDRTGRVPLARSTDQLWQNVMKGRLTMARRLFLTDPDITPLLVLGTCLTGRNGETLKELPPTHRLVEDRAVAITLTKRRRGKSDTRETVYWETGGSDSRQLHTPGGFYLLLHQLTDRGRRFSGGNRIWSIWAGLSGARGYNWDSKDVNFGHVDPFASTLARVLNLSEWGTRHDLTSDDGKPLKITVNRIKTTVEVRTTKAMGGHLPSASRTNTLDVSFQHYLQGDPVVRAWAEEIMTTALEEAESTARQFKPRVLDTATEQALRDGSRTADSLGITPQALTEALDGKRDTLANSCLDIEHGPFDEGRCGVSFLTCLRCPNALITRHHLPALLALVDELEHARQQMPLDAWVTEHGRTWLALTRLILPKFTDAQRAQAATSKPPELVLDLLDGPKES
ncbi:hypothetical protein ACWGIV_07780 [Streptomyces sp. NPDC054844]